MKHSRFVAPGLAVALLLIAGAMSAHHSESINDQGRLVMIEGTVTRFAFTNPHVQIYVDAKDEQGEIEQWIVTAANPTTLRRDGWNNKTFQPGDEIAIVGFPYKDGRKILFQLRVVRANGEKLSQSEGSRGRWERFLATHPDQQVDPRFK